MNSQIDISSMLGDLKQPGPDQQQKFQNYRKLSIWSDQQDMIFEKTKLDQLQKTSQCIKMLKISNQQSIQVKQRKNSMCSQISFIHMIPQHQLQDSICIFKDQQGQKSQLLDLNSDKFFSNLDIKMKMEQQSYELLDHKEKDILSNQRKVSNQTQAGDQKLRIDLKIVQIVQKYSLLLKNRQQTKEIKSKKSSAVRQRKSRFVSLKQGMVSKKYRIKKPSVFFSQQIRRRLFDMLSRLDPRLKAYLQEWFDLHEELYGIRSKRNRSYEYIFFIFFQLRILQPAVREMIQNLIIESEFWDKLKAALQKMVEKSDSIARQKEQLQHYLCKKFREIYESFKLLAYPNKDFSTGMKQFFYQSKARKQFKTNIVRFMQYYQKIQYQEVAIDRFIGSFPEFFESNKNKNEAFTSQQLGSMLFRNTIRFE